MNRRIINHLSYEETLKNLATYHKIAINEICDRFNFPKSAYNKYIGLRKNVEIGMVASKLNEWEYEAVFAYGNKHVYQENYLIIFDAVKKIIIPRKAQEYGCRINYSYAFPPQFYKKMIYSFFINFFEKPIFKNFNSKQGILEQEIVTKLSAFFRKQNKYGPEKISVGILDDQFITIIVSGLITPFLKELINNSHEDASYIERMFIMQSEKVLEQILGEYFNTTIYEPFIYFDRKNDNLIIFSSLSKEKWIGFLEEMYI